MPTKKKSDTVEAELLARITATKFDRSGLRIHAAPIARHEYDFRGVEAWEEETVAHYEYAREIQRHYDASKIFYEAAMGSRRAKKEMEMWKFPAPNPLIGDGLFPMPWMELRSIMGPNKKPPTAEKMGAIIEIDQEWFERGMVSENPDLSFHRIRIDWSRGRDAIKKEVMSWIDSMSKEHQTLQRRPKTKVISDRLDQLAAWRAHRAGLNHAAFTALSPRMPYSGATAFRRAHQKADKILRSFNDAAWLMAQKKWGAHFRAIKKG